MLPERRKRCLGMYVHLRKQPHPAPREETRVMPLQNEKNLPCQHPENLPWRAGKMICFSKERGSPFRPPDASSGNKLSLLLAPRNGRKPKPPGPNANAPPTDSTLQPDQVPPPRLSSNECGEGGAGEIPVSLRGQRKCTARGSRSLLGARDPLRGSALPNGANRMRTGLRRGKGE